VWSLHSGKVARVPSVLIHLNTANGDKIRKRGRVHLVVPDLLCEIFNSYKKWEDYHGF